MSESDHGTGEQLAEWLKEAGRRTPAKPPAAAAGADADDSYNSPASLHRYLEELAGRRLSTHTEVREFLREVAGTQPAAHRERERRRMVREVALLFLLALSYLHFYYWEVQLEIVALNSVRTFIPAVETRSPARRQL
jgi:hypothetical protein